MQAFQPIDGSNVQVSASTTSARGAIAKQPTGKHQLRICINGDTGARYKVGDSSVTATTADPFLPGNAVEVITVLNNPANPQTHVAFLTDSDTTTAEITTGHGL